MTEARRPAQAWDHGSAIYRPDPRETVETPPEGCFCDGFSGTVAYRRPFFCLRIEDIFHHRKEVQK